VTRPLTENELQAMHLMIGQRVLGWIAASAMLGHVTLRGSTIYIQGRDPISEFVWAAMGGQTQDALEALDVLIKRFPDHLAVALEGFNDTSESTGIASSDDFRTYCMNRADRRSAAA
jgi:hypothetical protein